MTSFMASEIKKIITDYLRELEERKKRTTRTVAHYDLYLQRFSRWLAENKIANFDDINVDVVASYREWLENYRDPIRKTILNKSTLNYYLIAVRGLIEFATRKGNKLLRAADVKLSKISKNSLNHLKKDELILLLEAPGEIKQDKIIQLRDEAILEILFCSGLKVSQLAAATKAQIKKTITGKYTFLCNENRNECILSNQAANSLEKYLSLRKDKNNFLFISHDNAVAKRRTQLGLSVRSIERIIARYAKHAKIKTAVTPQVIRNTHLVNKLLNGENLENIKSDLGFSNINTLKEYLRKI